MIPGREGGIRELNFLPLYNDYLEYVDTLATNKTKDFVLVIEVSPVHLCRFVDSMLNLHRHACASLSLLDNLETR